MKIGDVPAAVSFSPRQGDFAHSLPLAYRWKALRRERVRRPALTIRIYTRGFRVEIMQDSLRRAIFSMYFFLYPRV